MIEKPYLYSSAKFWRGVFTFGLLISFLIGFWREVKLIWELILAFIFVAFGWSVSLPLTSETFQAVVVVSINLAIVIFGYLFALYWVSQFTLPVYNSRDKKEVFKRLFFYNLPFGSSRGPAIFVKEGKPIVEKDELEGTQPGVALVDLYSALVLEQQSGDTDANTGDISSSDLSESNTKTMHAIPELAKRFFREFGYGKKEEAENIVRAFGPGLVFTKAGEKVIGWADLRKQFRIRSNICCNTGDGIEVTTKVSILFTLGQPPDILKVVKVNDKWVAVKVENTAIDDVNNKNAPPPNRLIKSFSDELNNDDKNEIDTFFNQGNFIWAVEDSGKIKIENSSSSPFTFDEERVIDAVYSRARDAKEGRLGDWTDLPVDVAVEIFRNKLAHETYDELYMPKDPNKYPMKDFKAKFLSAARNTGVLRYQIVRRKDGHPLAEGQICKNSELVFSPPKYFNSPAVLRDRGIKVLAAGFSELIPTNDMVRAQFFDSWRARWQQETEKTLADHELQATRIRNRERAEAQQDMIYSISEILQTDHYTSEALAMRLYQALESAATQPATQRLLPRDTINMLRNLRQWLLPEEQQKDNRMDNGFIEDEEESSNEE